MNDRKKREYFLHLASDFEHSHDLIKEILSGQVVHKTVFPGIVCQSDLTETDWAVVEKQESLAGFEEKFKQIKVDSVNDFDLSLFRHDVNPHSAWVEIYFREMGNENGLCRISLSFPPKYSVSDALHIDFGERQSKLQYFTVGYLLSLFHELVPKFKPSIGYASESGYSLGYCILEHTGRQWLLELNWITYYGTEFLEIVGRERIERLKGNVAHYEELPDGSILVCVVDELFSSDNPEHIEKLLNARKIVAFEEIATEIIEETEPEVVEFDPKDYKPDPDLD